MDSRPINKIKTRNGNDYKFLLCSRCQSQEDCRAKQKCIIFMDELSIEMI